MLFGFVAQLVEQLTLNQLVEGSSPSGPKFNFKSGKYLYFMHKNFLIALLILLFACISFFFYYTKTAKYYLSTEYQKEINQYIEKQIPICTKAIENLPKEIEAQKDPIDRQTIVDWGIDIILFDFYSKMLEITDKYKYISDKVLETDFYGELQKVIYPYLKNNNIDMQKIYSFLMYAYNKQVFLEDKYRN